MRKLGCAWLAIVALAGCTQQQMNADADRRLATYEPQRRAYFNCGIREAKLLIAKKPGTDPAYIVIAARAACETERADVIAGIEKAHNSEIWDDITRIADRKFAEIVIRTVLAS